MGDGEGHDCTLSLTMQQKVCWMERKERVFDVLLWSIISVLQRGRCFVVNRICRSQVAGKARGPPPVSLVFSLVFGASRRHFGTYNVTANVENGFLDLENMQFQSKHEMVDVTIDTARVFGLGQKINRISSIMVKEATNSLGAAFCPMDTPIVILRCFSFTTYCVPDSILNTGPGRLLATQPAKIKT